MTDKNLMPCIILAMILLLIVAMLFGWCVSDADAATEPTAAATEQITEPTDAETEPEDLPTESPAEPTYTQMDLDALALIIYMEAGSDTCSDATRLGVATVVLNRVADPRFPDTIEDVALQKSQYGRLHWTGLVWPDRAKHAGEKHAVTRAYEIAQLALEGARAFGSDVVWQAEFKQGRAV